jgi:hypothetical protein
VRGKYEVLVVLVKISCGLGRLYDGLMMGEKNFVWLLLMVKNLKLFGYGVLRDIWDNFWLKMRNLVMGVVNLRLKLMFMLNLGEVGGW